MDSASTEDFREDNIARNIIKAAIAVHKHFGPGLLESLYEVCLCQKLISENINIRRQVPINVSFEGQDVGLGFRLDLLVEERVIVEVKAVEKILPIHEAQLLSYMKLSDKRLGLIINFNEILVKSGIKRLVLRRKELGVLGDLGGENIVELDQ